MKTFCIGLLLASFSPALRADDLLLSGGGREHSRTPKRVWIRRATLVAGCAASLGFDTMSTHRAVNAGAIESNGLLADSQGHPRWGLTIGLKAGVCAASAFLQESPRFQSGPKSDWVWTGANIGTTAGFTWAGFHNLQLANSLSNK